MEVIDTLADARRWVWAKLARRGGQATKAELEHIWDYDPALLDDALRAMRADGIISYTKDVWYILDGSLTLAQNAQVISTGSN